MTKAPTPTEKSKNNVTTQNFDYILIADRLRTVSCSNNSHPTGVVKPGLKDDNLSTYRKSSVINRHNSLKNCRKVTTLELYLWYIKTKSYEICQNM